MSDRRRVMLVEDSPTQAARLSALLESEDLEILHVSSAEAALDQLQSARVDVILLDYHLPGMNGDEFCREIRLNVNTRAIPVLMLTVEGNDASEMRGLNSGADDYLTKSADPDVLRVRVRALVRRSEGIGTVFDDDKHFSRARVLAIDDSPTYLYLLALELKGENYIVETATGPDEALARVKEVAFDCVLIDYEMPGLDGAEVCRRIRDMHRDSEPEVVLIMLTSHDDKEHMALGFEAGADDYIAKSSDLAVTKARIRALLRRKFLVEENRRIFNELKEKELQAIRARAEREAAELRATMADQLALANRHLEKVNRKLDIANQELEQFAYFAAHDLQEPLRMVASYSQLLQRRYARSLDEQGNQFVAYCVEGAQRMDRMVTDLLRYARATSTEEEVHEPVDFNTVVERALANLQGAIEESNAEVRRDPLPILCIEQTRIQQLFQNLIGNAIKYRREGVPPIISIQAERTENDWVFSVRDNGIGIDPENLDKVFDVFKRFHQEKYSGTGLGLAICQKMVERYGGRIWVESELHQGSSFRFTLPANLESSEQPVQRKRA
jgi:two-component system NtrC family sensor kinase